LGAVLLMLLLTMTTEADATRKAPTKKWVLFTALCFLSVGLGQVLALAPSHWMGWRDEARLRPPFVFFFSFIVFVAVSVLTKQRFSGAGWRAALIATVCGILFMVCLWGSADAMAKIGLSGIVYPIAIAGSIVLFGLYSLFVLKERYRPKQILGMICGMAGIILLGLK
jgi:drug/metabolite transporter (DMT)-like permease